MKLNTTQQRTLDQIRGLSAGSFSYRVGTTDGQVIESLFFKYVAWAREYMETGKQLADDYSAWEQFLNISVDGIPKYQTPEASSFVVCKRLPKGGVQFLARDGSWGPLYKAWRASTNSAFGLFRARGSVMRNQLAIDLWGICKEHREPTQIAPSPPVSAAA